MKKAFFILLKIGHAHIMGWQVDSVKEETRFMVMDLTEGLQIEILWGNGLCLMWGL